MASARQWPYAGCSRGPLLGGLAAVACRDCAQAVSEVLHEGREDPAARLACRPSGESAGHLAGRGLGMRLEISGCVVRGPDGRGGLAVAGARPVRAAGRTVVRIVVGSEGGVPGESAG